MKVDLSNEERFLICNSLKKEKQEAERKGWRYKGENVWFQIGNIENKLKCNEVV